MSHCAVVLGKESSVSIFQLWARSCLLAFAGAMVTLTVPSLVHAQGAYPARTVTFIWPFAAGNPSGEAFRVYAEETGKILGRPMITDFRGGAGGRLGLQAVMAAPPDGYLVAAALDASFSAIPLMSDSFKPELGRDYSPVIAPVDSAPVLTSHPSLPFRDVRGLIAHVKANPGKLNFGSAGVGSWTHLALEVFLDAAGGLNMVHIPYKGGASAIADRLSGRVSLYISGADVASMVNSGQLIGLAVIHPKRLASLPNMPTLAEAGLPQASLRQWMGIIAPSGTPQEVVARLNVAFNAALKVPAVVKAMEAGGWIINPDTSPDDFTRLVRSDIATWSPIVRRTGLKID